MDSNIEVFAAEIAALFSKEFDHAFKEQIKSTIIGFRATLLKQEFDKNGKYPVANINAICLKVITVPAVECCLNDEIECEVLRTELKVPSPVRTNKLPEPFMFVGTSNHEKAFTYIQPEMMQNILHTKFMKTMIFYAYYNNYIYTFNFQGGKLAIRDPFANPLELLDLVDCDGSSCLQEVIINEDMKKPIRQMIIEDFRGVGILPNDKEIRIKDATQS